ncbi:hypothetical protein N0V82_007993 [Gnomoniopsis sp. IMI 355080]|nr:hypothetical protein N0V82_007993 [Gnomoniopsis sp. IMI 355080]
MSGIPSLSWPNAHANETYIALGIEMPIAGIVGSDPELIFLGAESYLLFMQDGMTMSAYNHLNISDNLLSSSIDPLVSFNEPSGIFSQSPFSSSSDEADLRLLAVLLYKSNTHSQSAAKQSSSSSEGVLSEIADLLDGDTQETEEFNWNAWAADMNVNPFSRKDFDVSDFTTKAGLGTPVAAEVLIIKDEAELTDSVNVAGSWDIVSTLYQTDTGGNAAGTATAIGAAASGMGAAAVSGTDATATGVRAGPAGLGLMPSSGAGAAGMGSAVNPSGPGSSLGAAAAGATGSPLTSTGPDSESDDTSAGEAGASDTTPGSSAGESQPMNASPSGSGTTLGGSNGSSSGLVVVPVASNSTLGASASAGRPLNPTGPAGTSDGGSDDTCEDDDEDDNDGSASLGSGTSGSGGLASVTARPTGAGLLRPSGVPKQPKYPFPQYSGASDGGRPLINATALIGQANATVATPTKSAVEAGITGGGKAAPTHGEQVTIDIDIGSEFETKITANLKYRNARRTVDAKPGWTLTLKTDLVAPTPSFVKRAEATSSTVVPTSTPKSVPRYAYRHESSTLHTTASATGSPSASGSVAPSSFVTTSSAGSGVIPTQVLSILGFVCISLLFVPLF